MLGFEHEETKEKKNLEALTPIMVDRNDHGRQEGDTLDNGQIMAPQSTKKNENMTNVSEGTLLVSSAIKVRGGRCTFGLARF